MGLFNKEEDEYGDPIEQEETPAPASVDVKKYLTDKYGLAANQAGPSAEHASTEAQFNKIASDNSGVESARKDADRSKMITGILEGLSTAFAGSKRTDSGFYDNLRKGADAKVATATGDKQQKLADLLAQSKLQRQGVEDKQGDKKFGWAESDEDPASPKAAAARPLLAKKIGIDPSMLEGLGYADQIKLVGAVKKTDPTGRPEGAQLKAAETPNGEVHWFTFDPATKGFVDTGVKTGYKMTFDSTTGTQISGATKGDTAAPVKAADGGSLADVRTGLTGARAQATAEGTTQAKDNQAVQEAEANLESLEGKSTRWLEMYDAAHEASRAGPGGAQIAKFQNRFGFGSDEAADRLSNEMALWGNQYIHDVTGASMPMSEFTQRFQPVLPQRGDDPQLIRSKLAGFQQILTDEVAKKKKVATPPGGQAPQQAAAGPAAPQAYSPEQETQISAYMADPAYRGKTREQIIKAMKKQQLLP